MDQKKISKINRISYFRNRDPRVGYFGWCVFARNKPQDWVKALFQMPYE